MKNWEEEEYVYVYEIGKKEFVTGSYQLALNRNQSDNIYVLSNKQKYLLGDINEN
tara:strand:- start:1186 stop:1350 length:165 start_codon:yes stop_codon:yes gene_type:complete